MYDGHLIDRFIHMVNEKLAEHGYPRPQEEDEPEPLEIPLVEAA